MDNFEYLNQISQSNRPTSRPIKQKGLSTSLVIKLVAGGAVLFIFLLILGGILGSFNRKPIDLTKQLYIRTTNVNTTLTTYNRSLKSSKLRAIGSSLSPVLTNTANQLAAYLKKDDEKNGLIPNETVAAQEAEVLAKLDNALNTAKLNGILDRIYDNEVGLQISLLLALSSELLARTKDQELISILTPFQSSLQTIRADIEAYTSM